MEDPTSSKSQFKTFWHFNLAKRKKSYIRINKSANVSWFLFKNIKKTLTIQSQPNFDFCYRTRSKIKWYKKQIVVGYMQITKNQTLFLGIKHSTWKWHIVPS
jgi:hypothetical protein